MGYTFCVAVVNIILSHIENNIRIIVVLSFVIFFTFMIEY